MSLVVIGAAVIRIAPALGWLGTATMSARSGSAWDSAASGGIALTGRDEHAILADPGKP